jgi:hypothetical protein
MRNPAENLADAIREQLGGFVPQDAGELDLFFENLPQVFSTLGQLAPHLADRDWISDTTAEQLHQLAGDCTASCQLAVAARESHATGPAAFWRR